MIIQRAIEQIVIDNDGEDVCLTVAQDLNHARPTEKLWRVALRAPMVGGPDFPLFDPVNGSVELAGYGPTVRDAFDALRAKLDRFYA